MDAKLKAVIPAAGLGSRMLPVTKAVPKELLPAGRKPMIQHVVEEAVASGVEQICVVIREGKEVIRDYFERRQPDSLKRGRAIEELEELTARCELTFAYQREPRGMGDALLQAREFVGRDAFVLMVPDQLARAEVPATLQLARRWTPGAAVWSSLMRLPKEDAVFFVGARGFEFERAPNDDTLVLGRMLEEDEVREAYKSLAYEIRGLGRTIYPPEIFDLLGREFTNPRTGEVDMLKTFEALAGRMGHRGVLLAGEFFDLGTFGAYYHFLPRLWERGA
jgi:UTP--glucose-1-phosphate uridylyltransferase